MQRLALNLEVVLNMLLIILGHYSHHCFLSTKGAKKDGNSINAMYLELPVMAAARFNVADNTNIVVNAGPYLACGIAGKTKIDLGNDTERKV